MNLGLNGRRAFVGGSSAGLGRAVAAGLLDEGAHVTLCARGAEALERTRAELAATHGERVTAIPADLSRPDQAGRAVADAAARGGALDVLVTNTGGPPTGRFDEQGLDAWRAAVDLLLLSTVEMVRAALPWLRRSSQPRIVLIGSTSVLRPIDGLLLSNSVRSAVAGLARTLAVELSTENILVNMVLPGTIATDRIARLDDSRARASGRDVAEVAAERARAVPLGRVGRPEEFAAMCVFLASARASYVDGALIPVDGGLLVR
jgi:3-oxoacyl-[acyl-carrier protein] reductase